MKMRCHQTPSAEFCTDNSSIDYHTNWNTHSLRLHLWPSSLASTRSRSRAWQNAWTTRPYQYAMIAEQPPFVLPVLTEMEEPDGKPMVGCSVSKLNVTT